MGNLILDQPLRSAASEEYTRALMPPTRTRSLTGAGFYLVHTGEDGHDPAQHCRTDTGNVHEWTLKIH